MDLCRQKTSQTTKRSWEDATGGVVYLGQKCENFKFYNALTFFSPVSGYKIAFVNGWDSYHSSRNE